MFGLSLPLRLCFWLARTVTLIWILGYPDPDPLTLMRYASTKLTVYNGEPRPQHSCSSAGDGRQALRPCWMPPSATPSSSTLVTAAPTGQSHPMRHVFGMKVPMARCATAPLSHLKPRSRPAASLRQQVFRAQTIMPTWHLIWQLVARSRVLHWASDSSGTAGITAGHGLMVWARGTTLATSTLHSWCWMTSAQMVYCSKCRLRCVKLVFIRRLCERRAPSHATTPVAMMRQ